MKACTLPIRIHVLFLGLLVLWGTPLHAQIWPFGKSKKGSEATSAPKRGQPDARGSARNNPSDMPGGASERSFEPGVRATASKVPVELLLDPAFGQYAAVQIQLGLLAEPKSASLPVEVSLPEPGAIELKGTVPSNGARQAIVGFAKRLSSNMFVRDNLKVDTQLPEPLNPLDGPKLEVLITESLKALAPEFANQIRITARDNGVVIVNGNVPSYEQKLFISKLAKSQPGCTAVTNLAMVDVVEGGFARVTEDGQLLVHLTKLPEVSPDLALRWEDEPASKRGGSKAPAGQSIRDLVSRSMAADDAPSSDDDQRIIQEVGAALAGDSSITSRNYQIGCTSGLVTINGDLSSSENVQAAVKRAASVRGVNKIVARCQPISIQWVNGKESSSAQVTQTKDTPAKKGLAGLFSFGSGDEDRRYRDTLRKTISKKLSSRAKQVRVERDFDGLLIECEVANARDRNHVFKELEAMSELSNQKHRVSVRIKEFE